MKLHRNQPVVRILGILTGGGFLAVGLFALFGASPDLEPYARDRAAGFGIAALVAGAWAIAVSLLDNDLAGVWCKAPRPLAWLRRRPSPPTGASANGDTSDTGLGPRENRDHRMP